MLPEPRKINSSADCMTNRRINKLHYLSPVFNLFLTVKRHFLCCQLLVAFLWTKFHFKFPETQGRWLLQCSELMSLHLSHSLNFHLHQHSRQNIIPFSFSKLSHHPPRYLPLLSHVFSSFHSILHCLPSWLLSNLTQTTQEGSTPQHFSLDTAGIRSQRILPAAGSCLTNPWHGQ